MKETKIYTKYAVLEMIVEDLEELKDILKNQRG
jgi:hypothetical protein